MALLLLMEARMIILADFETFLFVEKLWVKVVIPEFKRNRR